MSNTPAVAPGTRVSSFPRCPSLSHSPSGPAQTPGLANKGGAGPAASRPGLNCRDGRQEVCTFIARRHRDNGNTGKAATAATAATLVAGRGKRLQKRRRAPPGGRAAPARTVRPWGGRPVPSFRKLIRKVPSYATTSSGFPPTGGVSATGTRCSVSPIELQHMRKGLRRAYR